MAVYVDDMYKFNMGKLGRMKMSHMIADSKSELLEMAENIGLNLAHIQHEGTTREHFDVSISKRALAVKNGAQELTMKELGKRILGKRAT